MSEVKVGERAVVVTGKRAGSRGSVLEVNDKGHVLMRFTVGNDAWFYPSEVDGLPNSGMTFTGLNEPTQVWF